MTIAESYDSKAKSLSNNLKRTEGELLELLMQMKKSRLFAELGYSGIYSYCEGALRLSPAQSHDFTKVAQKSEEVPQLKAAIDQGEITLSQARRIATVLNQENQSEWIQKAGTLKQRELEQAVTFANPDAKIPKEKLKPITPKLSELKIVVTVEEEKAIRRIQDLLSKKMRKPVGLKEALMLLGKDFLRKQDPVKRAERLVARKQVAAPEQRLGRQPIRKPVQHEVYLRDKGQCAYVAKDNTRCQETRWTELHHKVPVSLGGRNIASNLVTLCSQHHRFFHRK